MLRAEAQEGARGAWEMIQVRGSGFEVRGRSTGRFLLDESRIEEDTGGMATAVPIRMQESAEGPIPMTMTEQEYLRTVFHPDCEFVEGRIEVRNVGEFEHSRVQLDIAHIFRTHEREWNVVPVTECRLQVSASHYRIPDV